MEWAVVARVASSLGQKPVENHSEGAVQEVGGHKEGAPVFVVDAQLAKQSPVMGRGWSGAGDLLTVVANSLHFAPQNSFLGVKESEKEKYKD